MPVSHMSYGPISFCSWLGYVCLGIVEVAWHFGLLEVPYPPSLLLPTPEDPFTEAGLLFDLRLNGKTRTGAAPAAMMSGKCCGSNY